MGIKVKNKNDREITLISVYGEVYAAGETHVLGIGQDAFFLGHASIDWSHMIPRNGEGDWTVDLQMSKELLKEVEELRQGRDLTFMIRIRFVAAIKDAAPGLANDSFVHAHVDSDSGSYAFCHHRIPKSDWLRHLKELGFGDYYLLELPLRKIPERAGFKKAVAHLESAWSHFGESRDDETLWDCYRAFEYLAKKAGCENPDQNAFEKLLSGVTDDAKKKRLKALMHYLCQFFHAGRHETGSEKAVVDRRDAEYALILSQATLAYLAKHTARN